MSHWLGHLRDPPSHSPALRHVGKVSRIEEPPHCGPAYPAPASGVCVTSGREPLSPRPVSGVRVSEANCLPCLLPGLRCLLTARPHHRPRGDFPALAVELQRPGRAAKGHAAPVRWPQPAWGFPRAAWQPGALRSSRPVRGSPTPPWASVASESMRSGPSAFGSRRSRAWGLRGPCWRSPSRRCVRRHPLRGASSPLRWRPGQEPFPADPGVLGGVGVGFGGYPALG